LPVDCWLSEAELPEPDEPFDVAVDGVAAEPPLPPLVPEPAPLVSLAWAPWLAGALWLADDWLVEPVGSEEPVCGEEPGCVGELVGSGELA
jgi:hypothetical protein